MAPLVIATETAPAPIAVAEAEAAPLVLSDDQLAPLVLPSEAPLVAIENAAEPASSDGAEPVAPTPAPAIVRLPADQLPAIEMPTEAPPVVEAQSELPVLIATPIGDPEDGRFASGKVIIRRGDNLWTIARRVYGRGIEYTVIFDANREKIANPHWIFPGQVFDLPENEQR